MALSVVQLFNEYSSFITDNDKQYESTLCLLCDFIDGGSSSKMMENDIEIIKNFMNHFYKIKRNTFPSYINNIFSSFCKQQRKIIINVNNFDDSNYGLLSNDFIINKTEPYCGDIISISNITKLFTECNEIQIIYKKNISSIYLNELIKENESWWHENSNFNFKNITFCNVKMEGDICNDMVFEHYEREFCEYQYELIYNDNNNDLILKYIDNDKERLMKSIEYKEIYEFVEDEMSKLLIMDATQNIDDTQKEYKTAIDLLSECRNCKATDIYNECESMKRIIILLTAYKKLMDRSKLWRKVSILAILTYKNIYRLTQINDDFIHIKDHIDDDDKLRKELHILFQTKFDCIDLIKCHGYGRWRYRANYVYPEWLNNEDIVFQEECDKIHSYLMHFEEDKYISAETINHGQHENIQNMKEYSGKIEDSKWWHYKIDDEMDDECIYHQLTQNMGIFRWQSPHGFSSKQYEGLMHLKPKYENIKQEVLHNAYYYLSTDAWNQTLRKAKVFFNSFARKRIKTCYDGKYIDIIIQETNKWNKNEVINMEEIVILKLYTDFDKLQYELKKCFRFETISDIFTLKNFDPNNKYKYKYNFYPNNKDIKDLRYRLEIRLQTFYWWRVRLLTVLNKYSLALNKNITLYHGVNGKMIINNGKTEGLGFYGPLSTSSSYHVARTFATAKGMVLQISSQYPRLAICRGFNASLISDYPEEKEWLIGFAYLTINAVLTRPLKNRWQRFKDIDDDDIIDCDVPLASITRSIFFAIHLFRYQIFSMSIHLEYWLTAFLYLQCGYNEKENDEHIKKTKFVKKIIDAVKGKDSKYNKDKKDECVRWQKILNILWRKFENFRKFPNQKQVVKMDEISDNLKPYFMDYDGEDIHKKDKYIISFTKINKIFENVQEIHFINNYIFDNITLNKLILYIHKNPYHKLKKIKFLYYDYDIIQQQKNKNDKTRLYPTDPQIFFDPEQLDKDLLNTLKKKKWELKHKNIGKTGYQIQIFLVGTDELKPNIKANKFEREQYKEEYSKYQIPKHFTNSIPKRIIEKIPYLYHYMIKGIALHKNNTFCNVKYKDQYIDIKIFNYDFHDSITDEILYCIAKKSNKSGFQWKMMDILFTTDDIQKQFSISSDELPESWKMNTDFIKQLNDTKDVEKRLEQKADFQQHIVQKTKWQTLTIYNETNNVNRRTLSLNKREFMKQIDPFTNSTYNNNVTPIIMPNKTNKANINNHHIEFVQIVRLNEADFDIGISYKFEKQQIKPVGIHLDKAFIQRQHSLISPLCLNNKCECLQYFKSDENVHHLFVGNPDIFETQMNHYKDREQKLRTFIKDSTTYFNKTNGVNIQKWTEIALIALQNTKHNDDCLFLLLLDDANNVEEDEKEEKEEKQTIYKNVKDGKKRERKKAKKSTLNPNAAVFSSNKLTIIDEKKEFKSNQCKRSNKRNKKFKDP